MQQEFAFAVPHVEPLESLARHGSAKGAIVQTMRLAFQGNWRAETEGEAVNQMRLGRIGGAADAVGLCPPARELKCDAAPEGIGNVRGNGDQRCTERFLANQSLASGHSSCPVPITGPKYFFQLEDEPCSDGPAAGFVPRHDAECEDATKVPQGDVSVRIASWNVAGIRSKTVQLVFDQLIECDIVSVQEFPKQDAGWKTVEGDVFRGLVHQNYSMYRGVGILYKADKFQLLKRKAAARGMWALLRHVGSGTELWVGSVHLPNSEPREEVQRLMKQVVDLLPKNAEKAILLGDFNVQFSWRQADGGVNPGAMTAKWAGVRQQLVEAGFLQLPPGPTQTTTPTFHSRKGNVASTQIDGAFLKGHGQCNLDIQEGSRHQVGTDHDRVEVQLRIKVGQRQKRKMVAGGPRVIASEPPPRRLSPNLAFERLPVPTPSPSPWDQNLDQARLLPRWLAWLGTGGTHSCGSNTAGPSEGQGAMGIR